jgi:hypothetical protein
VVSFPVLLPPGFQYAGRESAEEKMKMLTLPIRAPQLPNPLSGFARIASFVDAVFDVFADAQDQARAARARYPFMAW